MSGNRNKINSGLSTDWIVQLALGVGFGFYEAKLLKDICKDNPNFEKMVFDMQNQSADFIKKTLKKLLGIKSSNLNKRKGEFDMKIIKSANDYGREVKSSHLIKSGAGAGYTISIEGIELDDRNYKIISDEITDERYNEHTTRVEVPVKPCVVDEWSAESYYDAISSERDFFDSTEDSKIEGGKAVLDVFWYQSEEGRNINDVEFESAEEACDALIPKDFGIQVLVGAGWAHSYLPVDKVHFEDEYHHHPLNYYEDGYDCAVISADLVCPNICQDINAFFENPEEYYDDYQGDEEIESSKKIHFVKSANNYGWEVDSSEVPEALDLFVEYVGKETALEEIARAMGTDVLEENLDWVIRQWGFAEDVEDMDDVWEKFEYAKEVMGADELYENLTQAAGHDELAEDLAFIFRQYDFREWDERKGNIDSGCHGKGKKKGKKEIKSARAESIWYVVANGSKFYYATKEEAEEAFDIGKSVGPKVSGPYEETDPDEIADVYEAGLLASGRKFVKSMARSYLRPEYDARKSFYNKAETDDDKLYSYGTLVAEIVDGEPVLHDKWDYSATTIRHVKEWLQQNGFEAGTKQEIGRKYKKAEN